MAASHSAGGVPARVHAHLDAGCDVVLVCHPELVDEALHAVQGRSLNTAALLGLLGRGALGWDGLLAAARHGDTQSRLLETLGRTADLLVDRPTIDKAIAGIADAIARDYKGEVPLFLSIMHGALPFAGNPELISRTHLARYLVEAGYCPDVQTVFTKHLGDDRPGHVPMQWATLAEAVGWIRGAGGIAVIAHPGRYKYTPLQFAALFDEFLQLGGLGIEVNTGSHTAEEARQYAEVARRYGFLASRGSDFHSPKESRMDLGRLPPLPSDLKPVWHDWF
ncbi:hypothetical protein G6F65_015652 [Rhizopus arrhizus]|nr:hypothetical protein G6F65_015652 [Rhizopus arrhizus]